MLTFEGLNEECRRSLPVLLGYSCNEALDRALLSVQLVQHAGSFEVEIHCTELLQDDTMVLAVSFFDMRKHIQGRVRETISLR